MCIYTYVCTCCQWCSVPNLCLTLCNPMNFSTPLSSVLHYPPSLLKFMSIESMMLLTISLSATQFFCLPSFPASDSFPMNQFFTSGGQSVGVLASVSVLSMDIQDLFPFEWSGWISLQSKGLIQKHQFFSAQLSSQSNSRPYMTTGKTIALTRWTFVGEVMSLLFNMLSSLVIAFLLEQPVF